MRAAWKMFCLSVAVLAAAIVVAQLLVPGIVPIAFAEEPQPSWSVMTAFVLRAIELMTAAVAIIALAMLAGMCARRGLRRLSGGAASQAD
ncbi:hypothetical protein A5906_11965 [Bradyrhizobium sacchari]|uniref:Uncharacterized protein n=1 Tax=Bradyrhizobium sacchari TaxID=1399419 RepID=A0A560JT64_9BRAD|nr:hypothetical protein [Bradyrhizobium sacchari]OPY94944.1 hypothetical protein A5906_11965 [Bradyrhizobium sacchari]TWB59995.1 hypothetical protein FBZ94_104219 [Bradyrhizobium sacchari]TWB74196.1 hypothetical protein FBZ95_105447 [Bradyrhizobium sacchari]